MSALSAAVGAMVLALIFSLLGFGFKKIGLRLGWIREGAPACPIHSNDTDLVCDEDLAWWNSLSEKEVEEIYKDSALANEMGIVRLGSSEGSNIWDAANSARRRMCQFYCWPSDRLRNIDLDGDDNAKLPYALWKRVNGSLGSSPVSEDLLKDISSANAYVRDRIRSGLM